MTSAPAADAQADDLPGLPHFLLVEGMVSGFEEPLERRLEKDPEAKRFPIMRCFYGLFFRDYAAAFSFSVCAHITVRLPRSHRPRCTWCLDAS